MKIRIRQSIRLALFMTACVVPLQAGAWWGHGPGYSHWGPFDGFGDMFGDMNFNLSMRGNARSRYHGYGYFRPFYGYGYPYYPPVYLAYAYPLPQPVAAVRPVEVAPADDDVDGVINASDLCPDSAAGAKVDAFGCEVDVAIVLRGVNFHHDSDQLAGQSLAILDGVAATLTANPDIRVQVAGHTDSQGDDIYNKDLSQRRAASVVEYLAGKGVTGANLVPVGYGEEQPIADNDTAAGRAENRRVELVRLDR